MCIHQQPVSDIRLDFIVALTGGERIVMKVKGQQTDSDDSKHRAMREWVDAVIWDGSRGRWNIFSPGGRARMRSHVDTVTARTPR